MEVDFDRRFEEQRRMYGFCFTCETCSNFDDITGACLHGFPNHMHRIAFYEKVPRPAKVVFCKEFDLA